ncbi:hypothetical protein V1478_008219 [Vespula squamosa]|uniref:Uncharacterized protein n=1 Tax=Vespula squamosa TaxID=30214 RepID=A0ABD2AY57_VESSQ
MRTPYREEEEEEEEEEDEEEEEEEEAKEEKEEEKEEEEEEEEKEEAERRKSVYTFAYRGGPTVCGFLRSEISFPLYSTAVTSTAIDVLDLD